MRRRLEQTLPPRKYGLPYRNTIVRAKDLLPTKGAQTDLKHGHILLEDKIYHYEMTSH